MGILCPPVTYTFILLHSVCNLRGRPNGLQLWASASWLHAASGRRLVGSGRPAWGCNYHGVLVTVPSHCHCKSGSSSCSAVVLPAVLQHSSPTSLKIISLSNSPQFHFFLLTFVYIIIIFLGYMLYKICRKHCVLYSFQLISLKISFIYLFIYLWLCWVFVSVRGLSLVAASGGHSSSRCAGLSPSRPLVAEHRL